MKNKTPIISLLLRTLLAVGSWALSATAVAAILTVGKQPGPGVTHTNINEAVKAARGGDTINIGPGDYLEAVVISKDLTLNGAGPQYTRIIPTSGEAARVSPSVKASFFAITFSSTDNDAIYADLQSSLSLRNCLIDGAFFNGITHTSLSSVEGGLGPIIRLEQCTIVGCGRQGVYIDCYGRTSGDVTIRNCIFARNNLRAGDYQVFCNIQSVEGSGVLLNGKGTFINGNGLQGSFNGDPRFVDSLNHNYLLSDGSGARDKGMNSISDVDPDGTTPDLGAYGGAMSRAFWPYPANGPLIRELNLSQGSVIQGGKLTIRATATTR